MTCAFEISLFFLLEANILSSKRKFFCLLLDFWLVLNVFRFISLRFAKNRLLKSLFNRYFFLLALYVKCWRPPYRQLFRKQSKADLFYEINSVPGSKAKNQLSTGEQSKKSTQHRGAKPKIAGCHFAI